MNIERKENFLENLNAKDKKISVLESQIKLLRSQLEYFENILAIMPGHIYWQDKNNVFLGCNENQAKNGGFSSTKEMVGKTNYDMPWKEQADQLNKINLDVMKTGKPHIVEEFAEMTYGQGIFLSQKVPLRNKKNKIIGILGISFDITDRKKAEEELKIAKEKAEQANRAKTEFLSNAVTEMTKSFVGIKKTLKTAYKKMPKKEANESNSKIESVSQILHDMENFAKFDLIHSNPFSEDEKGIGSKPSKNSAENLKVFHEFYRQFNLARRESECVYYMVRGMTAKQIGRVTNLSYRTVEFYLSNAKLKLGCRTKQALISKVFESGVI
jgi:PAS domain S-box-containing protein